MRLRSTKAWIAASPILGLSAAACGGASNASTNTAAGSCTQAKSPVITLAAYSTVYDVYGKLITDFQSQWKDAHNGQNLIFQTSFGGSTTQAQNVVNGFKADIVALSLIPDVQLIQKAGLITQPVTDGSIVSTTAVVFDVRAGDPKGIHDWADLAKPGVQILTPDPA